MKSKALVLCKHNIQVVATEIAIASGRLSSSGTTASTQGLKDSLPYPRHAEETVIVCQRLSS
jgi:hypothetical protein